MKLSSALFLAIALALLGTFATLLLQAKDRYAEQQYPMDVNVENTSLMGINVDPDGFHFGTLNWGSGSARELSINQVEKPTRVRFTTSGAMAAWVQVPEPFVILPNESKILRVSIGIPPGTPYGNYSGTVTVILEEP
ncbi:MAG: hypothetical protein Q7S65_05720 [Nanoarchaeota archaeon]|nr:hypothetical protein [Nanoarchaeota archaeon]